MGAVAAGGIRILNENAVRALGIPARVIAEVEAGEREELERRERAYRAGRGPLDVRGKIVILVDDGLATGSTMRAAVAALRRMGPARVVVAVPVGARDVCEDFEDEADEAICAQEPDPFYAVGSWYDDFTQTTDAEVRELLGQNEDVRAG